MMQRYGWSINLKPEGFDIKMLPTVDAECEEEQGEWVKYTDAMVEIYERDGLLDKAKAAVDVYFKTLSIDERFNYGAFDLSMQDLAEALRRWPEEKS